MTEQAILEILEGCDDGSEHDQSYAEFNANSNGGNGQMRLEDAFLGQIIPLASTSGELIVAFRAFVTEIVRREVMENLVRESSDVLNKLLKYHASKQLTAIRSELAEDFERAKESYADVCHDHYDEFASYDHDHDGAYAEEDHVHDYADEDHEHNEYVLKEKLDEILDDVKDAAADRASERMEAEMEQTATDVAEEAVRHLRDDVSALRDDLPKLIAVTIGQAMKDWHKNLLGG